MCMCVCVCAVVVEPRWASHNPPSRYSSPRCQSSRQDKTVGNPKHACNMHAAPHPVPQDGEPTHSVRLAIPGQGNLPACMSPSRSAQMGGGVAHRPQVGGVIGAVFEHIPHPITAQSAHTAASRTSGPTHSACSANFRPQGHNTQCMQCKLPTSGLQQCMQCKLPTSGCACVIVWL